MKIFNSIADITADAQDNEEMLFLISADNDPDTLVWTGFTDWHVKTPDEPGKYSLYEFANMRNEHTGFAWLKG